MLCSIVVLNGVFIRRSQRYRNTRAYCSDPHMSLCLPLIVGRQYPRMTCLYLVHTRLYRHCKNYRVRWCIFPVVRDKWRKWTADLEEERILLIIMSMVNLMNVVVDYITIKKLTCRSRRCNVSQFFFKNDRLICLNPFIEDTWTLFSVL